MRRKKPRSMEEREAQGEIERVFHEVRQIVRASGVSLDLRTLATFEESFPRVWDALRPNLESRAFEEAADELRREAVTVAEKLPRSEAAIAALEEAGLGESQRYRLAGALDLYHYMHPKLLVLTEALRLALRGELPGTATGDSREVREVIVRGVPASMHPMEMIAEEPEDPEVSALFEDIRRSYAMESTSDDFRSLALWPSYLKEAWQRLKALGRTDEYVRAADGVSQLARRLASSLPHAVDLTPARFPGEKEHPAVLAVADRFARVLPQLVLNMALLALDRLAAEVARASPFPARFRILASGVSS